MSMVAHHSPHARGHERAVIVCGIVLLSVLGNVLMEAIPVIGGLASYAYYAHIGYDPLKEGLIDDPNEVFMYIYLNKGPRATYIARSSEVTEVPIRNGFDVILK